MEQTGAPPPQPARLTTTESFEDQATNSTTTTAPAQPQKLRLMCSYGGHIVPRPHDKSLCYVGGETRIVVVNRHTTLSNLTNRLTKSLTRSPNTSSCLFNLKYQLPCEDLDSLISVTTDEDLDNMIDEYERLNNNNNNINSNRLRLFLFPVQPEPVSVSSIGSLLESEDWFVNALNGTASDTCSSINCLLGLDDDVLIHPEQKDTSINKNDNSSSKDLVGNKNLVQDVESVPDSPMLETNSSFGSASSLANLPPIRVGKVEEQPVMVGVINQPHRFDMTSPDSVSSDGSVSRRNEISNISEQSNRIQMQPPRQYILHHPSGAGAGGSYYQMYPPQAQLPHPHPPLDQHNFVYYMPATARHTPAPAGPTRLPLQTDVAPSGLFTAPRAVQAPTKGETPVGVYRTVTSGAPPPQLVHVPTTQHHLQPQYVGYSHIHQPAAAGGGGGSYAYELTDPSKRPHIYYAPQPLPPQSVAQYQTMTATLPVEPQPASHLQTDNSVKLQVRTSQP